MSKLNEAPDLTSPDDDDATERLDDVNESESFRTARMRKRIDALLNPDDLASELFKDRKLTRDQWYEKHANLSFQLIMRSIVREAVNGDGKCADLAIRNLTQWFDKSRQAKPDALDERSDQVQAELMQRPRPPQPVDE